MELFLIISNCWTLLRVFTKSFIYEVSKIYRFTSLITNKVCLGVCECNCTPFLSRPVWSATCLKICFSSKHISKEAYWIIKFTFFNSWPACYTSTFSFTFVFICLHVIICKNYIMPSPICCLVCYSGSKIKHQEISQTNRSTDSILCKIYLLQNTCFSGQLIWRAADFSCFLDKKYLLWNYIYFWIKEQFFKNLKKNYLSLFSI